MSVTSLSTSLTSYNQPNINFNAAVFNPRPEIKLQPQTIKSSGITLAADPEKSDEERKASQSLKAAAAKYHYLTGVDSYGNDMVVDKNRQNYVLKVLPKNSGNQPTIFIIGNGNLKTIKSNPNNINAQITANGTLLLIKVFGNAGEMQQTLPGASLSFKRGIELKNIDVVFNDGVTKPLLSFFPR